MKMKKLLTQCSILSMLAFCAAPPVMAMVDQEDDQRHVGTSIPAPQPQQSAPQPQQQEKEITVKIASLQEFEQAREKYTTSTDPFFPSHVEIVLNFFKATSPHTELLDYALQHGVRNLKFWGQLDTPSYLEKIFSAPYIEKLDLGTDLVLTEEDVRVTGNLLASNRSLKTLYYPELDARAVGSIAEAVRGIAEAFRVNTTLEEFKICELPVPAKVVSSDFSIAVIEAITNNPNATLKRLDLGHKIGVKGARAIGNLLLVNRSLTHLKLSSSGIGDEGVEALEEGLRKNTALECLDLSANNISSDGVCVLMSALRDNSHIPIHTLNLSWNKFDEKSASVMAEFLRRSNTLQELDLALSNVPNRGIQAIMSALTDNPQLPIHTLNLSRNTSFDRESAHAVGKFLSMSTTLQELSLEGNEITDELLTTIGCGIGLNRSLEKLSLHGNKVTEAGVRFLLTVLETNTSIKEIRLPVNSFWGPDISNSSWFQNDRNSSRLSLK